MPRWYIFVGSILQVEDNHTEDIFMIHSETRIDRKR